MTLNQIYLFRHTQLLQVGQGLSRLKLEYKNFHRQMCETEPLPMIQL